MILMFNVGSVTAAPPRTKLRRTRPLTNGRRAVVATTVVMVVLVVTASTSTSQQRSLRQRVSGGQAQTKQTQKNLKHTQVWALRWRLKSLPEPSCCDENCSGNSDEDEQSSGLYIKTGRACARLIMT